MDADAIKTAVEEAFGEYDAVGIRVVHAGHDGFPFDAGDEAPASYPWEDDCQIADAEPLDGCSCLKVNGPEDVDAILNRPGYSGTQLLVVAGFGYTRGQDPGEILIRNATVIAAFACMR